MRDGLFGFNGALVGIALLYFLEPAALTWGYVVLAAACTTAIMAALLHFLDVWKIPALTASFVVTTLAFILAGSRFGRLHSTDLLPTAGLPKGAVVVDGVVTASTAAEGLFAGAAQVFFQGNAITGAIGLLAPWAGCSLRGAAESAIRSGVFGFNPVLAAIALGSGFFVLIAASVAYASLGVVVTAVVFAAMSAVLEPLGMPALTSAFVLVVWLFLLASPLFQRLRVKTSV